VDWEREGELGLQRLSALHSISSASGCASVAIRFVVPDLEIPNFYLGNPI
ncbi:hypothetical protein Ocin01_06350, partial [Orchesella cincta]